MTSVTGLSRITVTWIRPSLTAQPDWGGPSRLLSGHQFSPPSHSQLNLPHSISDHVISRLRNLLSFFMNCLDTAPHSSLGLRTRQPRSPPFWSQPLALSLVYCVLTKSSCLLVSAPALFQRPHSHFKLFSISLFFFFWPNHAACRVLVPQPGIEPRP